MIQRNLTFNTLSIEDKLKFLGIYDEAKEYFENKELPKFAGIDEEAVKEAIYYSQQKRLLEESMKEYIATIKPTQHIEKELKTIELDALNREVEITKTKLKENVKRK